MIETRDLTKTYGELYALNRLTIKLDPGDVYGFIGPNGAGKTTTMRILATLLNPTWGEGFVCGHSIHTNPREIRRAVGYMPDFFGVYDDMKVIEYLEFFASAYRIVGEARRRKCEEVLELVDLTFKREALVTSLSRGMTQRLGLARVLLAGTMTLPTVRTGVLAAGLGSAPEAALLRAGALAAALFLAALAAASSFLRTCALEGKASATPILAALERRSVAGALGLAASTTTLGGAAGLATPSFKRTGFSPHNSSRL